MLLIFVVFYESSKVLPPQGSVGPLMACSSLDEKRERTPDSSKEMLIFMAISLQTLFVW